MIWLLRKPTGDDSHFDMFLVLALYFSWLDVESIPAVGSTSEQIKLLSSAGSFDTPQNVSSLFQQV